MIDKAHVTGKWRQPSVPHKGWSCVGFEDLGEPSGTCEMCEVTEIRYVHYMEHPKYPDTLACGCICAAAMESDYTAARRREQALKNTSRRKSNWLKRRWNVSSSGNPYINTDGFNIVIFHKVDYWSARIENRETNEAIFARRRYRTADEAKLAAFDAMIVLKQRQRQR